MVTGFHASGKESACIAGDEGWIPGLGRYTEEQHGNVLLENPWTEEASLWDRKESDLTEHTHTHTPEELKPASQGSLQPSSPSLSNHKSISIPHYNFSLCPENSFNSILCFLICMFQF